MGTSHFDSDVLAKAGTTPEIHGMAAISASSLTTGGTVTGATITDGTMSISSGAITGLTSQSMSATLTASNIESQGKITDGTFTTTSGAVTGVTSITAAQVLMSDNIGIFAGVLQTEASIVAVATAVLASPAGSLYLSTEGKIWSFDSHTTATCLIGAS